jgi:hypothetical protein
MFQGGGKAVTYSMDNTFVAPSPKSKELQRGESFGIEELNIIKSMPKLLLEKLNVDMPGYIWSKVAELGEKAGATPNPKLFPKGSQDALKSLERIQSERWNKIKKGQYGKGGSMAMNYNLGNMNIEPKSYAQGGGIDNPGFKALPDFVQAKIRANMEQGGVMKYRMGGRTKFNKMC